MLKNLAYISKINKNQKELNLLVNSKIKNLEINFNEKESKIDYKEYYFNGIPLEPVNMDNRPKPIVIKKQEVIQPIQPIVNYNKNEIMPVFQKVQVIQPIQHIVNYNINEIKPMIQNLNYEIKPKVKFIPKQEQIKANPK